MCRLICSLVKAEAHTEMKAFVKIERWKRSHRENIVVITEFHHEKSLYSVILHVIAVYL